MVFNAIFNNISVISWWSVLLVEETPFRTTEFSPVFSGVRVTWSLVLCVCFVDRCLSICTFSFGHCVVCSSSIYGFWLPLWYLQTLLSHFFFIIFQCFLFLLFKCLELESMFLNCTLKEFPVLLIYKKFHKSEKQKPPQCRNISTIQLKNHTKRQNIYPLHTHIWPFTFLAESRHYH
jgi:hypothetical protein